MAAPVRFQIKSKKRKPPSESTALCSGSHALLLGVVSEEAEAEIFTPAAKRVALLEDTAAKVKRLKHEGNVLAEAGKFRAAMARWQEALATDPENTALFELMAQASMAVYEDFNAIQYASKATQCAPEWSDAFHTLARCHLNFGELSLALENLDKAIKLSGGEATDDLESDRRDVLDLLDKQKRVLRKRDEEAAREVDAGKLQAISCLKHLSLRAKAVERDNAAAS